MLEVDQPSLQNAAVGTSLDPEVYVCHVLQRSMLAFGIIIYMTFQCYIEFIRM